MKTVFSFWLIFLSVLFTGLPLKGQSTALKIVYSDDELVIKEIDAVSYLVVHTFPWPANSLVLKFGKSNYLLIDTPYTDEATKKLTEWLQGKDTAKISVTAINTHFHVDNLGGNGYLKSIGSIVYGSDLTASLLKERGLGNGMLESFRGASMGKYYNYYKEKVLAAPNKIFPIKEELILPFGSDTVQVWYPGPGHTPDNVVVYYPKKKILFGGCILKSMESNSKGNTGDADLKNWSHSLENLLKKFPDARLIIPGHGKEGGVELISHSIEIVR